MGQVSKTLRRAEDGYAHWCPGCQQMHRLPDSWAFNGDVNCPTFSPSFKHEGKQRVFVNGQWTGAWIRDAGGTPKSFVCHYILTDGILNYCNDCTHELAGQSVPLPELPEGLTDA
jgi:hypothetical protein